MEELRNLFNYRNVNGIIIEKEFDELFGWLKGNSIVKYKDIQQWIEQKIIEAKIEELNRTIEMFMNLPESDYSDLDIKSILERRIKQLRSKE